MDEDFEDYWYDDEMLNSVSRYEEMLEKRAHYFFDVHEFEDIIDYYMDSENFAEASSAANYAARIYPQATSIQLRIAEILLDKGQAVKALDILNKVEPLESGEYAIYLMRGTALNMMGKPKEAQQQFEKAISMADENKAEVLYNIGMSFEKINQHNIALKYFLKVHALEPENYFMYYDLAYCYERLDEWDKCIACYQKYLDEDPYSDHVWYNLGIAYNKVNDNIKALEAYDFAIAIDPGYASALFNKANTLALLGHFRHAIESYLEFLEIEPENASAYCYIGECCEQLDEIDMAKIYYLRSLTIDPMLADAWFGMGVIRSQEDCHREAINYIQSALELDPGNGEYLYGLASAYANMKRYKKSITIFKKLTKHVPHDVNVWDSFAQVYAKKGEYREACKIIMEAININPETAILPYRLAAYLLLDNEREHAITLLKKILPIFSDDHDYFSEVYQIDDNDQELLDLFDQYSKP